MHFIWEEAAPIIRQFHLGLLPGVLRCFGWLALRIPVPLRLVSHVAHFYGLLPPEFLLPVLVLSLKLVSAFLTGSFLWLYQGERAACLKLSHLLVPLGVDLCYETVL